MESAALLLLTVSMGLNSSMGVMFGWQPMPDGSEKVEYIVQIEPELVATLQEGQSIPITSDIPDDIGSIGRIRIVVGRDELPRQTLATRFKPWPKQQQHEQLAKKSRDGIIETQLTVPPVQSSAGGRYPNQTAGNNQILPPGSAPSAQSNPFGQALQQGAQQARELASNAAQQILPPSGDQLFGQGGAGSSGVRKALDNGVDHFQNSVQRGMQRGVEQVADRTGQRLREAVDNAGQRAKGVVDEFGRSLIGELSAVNNRQGQSSATILPPDSGNNAQAGKGQRIDQPIQPRRQQPQGSIPPASFASTQSPTTGNNPTSQPGVFNAPWPPITRSSAPAGTVSEQPPRGYGNQAGQPVTQSSGPPPAWPNPPRQSDSHGVANQSGNGTAPQYSGSGMQGPQFPVAGTAPTAVQNNDPNWPANSPPAPEIRRDMMQGPSDGRVQTVSSQGYQEQTAARQPLDVQPRGYGLGDNREYSTDDSNNSSNSKTLFPLLLSWVLLSGSGAGNLYLFWSYLDVRSKYQGVVHGSPLRRDRYDD